LAGFEVKASSDHPSGIIQAARYREGVHEAYLCIPRRHGEHGEREAIPDWLRRGAALNGIGLVRAAPDTLVIDVAPEPPRPDPRLLIATRSALLGEVAVRAFGLNKPLHYAAVLVAYAFHDDPLLALQQDWALGDSAIRLAIRGAENLGLITGGAVTLRGKAYADVLRLMGFTLSGCRRLTRTRLASSAPHFAAALRTILLQHPAVDLIIQALLRFGTETPNICALAQRALAIDEPLASAVFGAPPRPGDVWTIRPTTRFQLKAALYDVGLVNTPLARGASGPQLPGGYDPTVDQWGLGGACRSSARPR
jgi:hypothetical protein